MFHLREWVHRSNDYSEVELERFAQAMGTHLLPAPRGFLDNALVRHPRGVTVTTEFSTITFDNAVQVGPNYDRRWYTRVRMPYHTLDGLRFRVQPRGFISDLMTLVGLPEVKTGDPAFQRRYLVRANDIRKAGRVFRSPGLRKLLLDTRQFDLLLGPLRAPSLARLLVLRHVSPGPLRPGLPPGVQLLFAETAGIAAAEELALLLALFQELMHQLRAIGSAADRRPDLML